MRAVSLAGGARTGSPARGLSRRTERFVVAASRVDATHSVRWGPSLSWLGASPLTGLLLGFGTVRFPEGSGLCFVCVRACVHAKVKGNVVPNNACQLLVGPFFALS